MAWYTQQARNDTFFSIDFNDAEKEWPACTSQKDEKGMKVKNRLTDKKDKSFKIINLYTAFEDF